MKIAYVATAILPSRSANSVHVMKMCSALAANGHDVVLLTPERPERLREPDDLYSFYGVADSFRIVKLPWPRIKGRGYFFAINAAGRAKRFHPELVYSRSVLAAYASALTGIPAIFESHAPVTDFGIADTYFFRRLISHPLLRKVVVISDSLRAHYEERYPAVRDRIMTARDGADEHPVLAASDEVEHAKSGRLQVGYSGQLFRGKGIEVIEAIAPNCPWAEFHIFGGMPEDLDFWGKRFEAIDNATLHGHRPHGEISTHIAQCDVMLAPYQRIVCVYGGRGDVSNWMSPLKVFEYMAAGKAMIVSDLPVLREMLNESNAILVDPEDPTCWIAALQELRSECRRKALGERARHDFVSAYSWMQRARRILA